MAHINYELGAAILEKPPVDLNGEAGSASSLKADNQILEGIIRVRSQRPHRNY